MVAASKYVVRRTVYSGREIRLMVGRCGIGMSALAGLVQIPSSGVRTRRCRACWTARPRARRGAGLTASANARIGPDYQAMSAPIGVRATVDASRLVAVWSVHPVTVSEYRNGRKGGTRVASPSESLEASSPVNGSGCRLANLGNVMINKESCSRIVSPVSSGPTRSSARPPECRSPGSRAKALRSSMPGRIPQDDSGCRRHRPKGREAYQRRACTSTLGAARATTTGRRRRRRLHVPHRQGLPGLRRARRRRAILPDPGA